MRNDERAVEKSKNTAKGFCKICNKEVNNLSNHVKFKHVNKGEIDSLQEYYHKYIICDDEVPACLNCGKEVEFISINKGYKRTCSHKCSMNAPSIKSAIQSKAKDGVKKKYGVSNISQVQEIKDKKKETFRKNYGKDHIWSNKEGEVRSCEKTMLEKYGIKHALQNKKLKEKAFKTNIEKFGFKTPLQNKEVKGKIKQTMLEKYNGYSFEKTSLLYPNFIKKIKENGGFTLENIELRKKFTETMLRKYKVESPMQNYKIMKRSIDTRLKKYGSKNNIEKIKQTVREKYGVDNVIQVPEFFEKAQLNNSSGKEKIYIKNIEGKQIGCSSFLEQKFVNFCNLKNIVVEKGDCIGYNFQGKDRKYHCDFKIKEKDGRWRLIETKGEHKWWLKDLESGRAVEKIKAAKEFSLNNNYHKFLIILGRQVRKTYLNNEISTEYESNIETSLSTDKTNNNFNSLLFDK